MQPMSAICQPFSTMHCPQKQHFPGNLYVYFKFPVLINIFPVVCAFVFPGHTNRILSMCLSPDQTVVMSAAADETLRRWSCFAGVSGQQKSVKGGKKRTSHALSVGQIR